jgi:hypothetical protein
MQNGEDSDNWVFQLKNLIILDRCVNELLCCEELKNLDMKVLYNLTITDVLYSKDWKIEIKRDR